MTNFEFYKGVLGDFSRDYGGIFAIVNKIPYECKDINFDCDNCESKCSIVKIIEWSMEEYQEPSLLTPQQRLFLESLGEGYIGRNMSGAFVYKKIGKDIITYPLNNIELLIGRFNFIKEDALWNIKDLLNKNEIIFKYG